MGAAAEAQRKSRNTAALQAVKETPSYDYALLDQSGLSSTFHPEERDR